MDILQIVIVGIIASILYMILKELNATIAFTLIIVTAIIIFLAVIQQIGIIFEMIQRLGNQANVEGLYLDTILRIIGIAYIAELGVSLAKDAGIQSVASKIELAGKIFILLLAVPIITALIEAIIHFLPTA